MQTRESWSTPACSAYGEKNAYAVHGALRRVSKTGFLVAYGMAKAGRGDTVLCAVWLQRPFWWVLGWPAHVRESRCAAPCSAYGQKKKHECDTRWSATAHLFLHRGGWRHGNYNPTSSHRNLNVNRNGIRSCRTIWTSQQCEQLVQIHAPPSAKWNCFVTTPNAMPSVQKSSDNRISEIGSKVGSRFRKSDLDFGDWHQISESACRFRSFLIIFRFQKLDLDFGNSM